MNSATGWRGLMRITPRISRRIVAEHADRQFVPLDELFNEKRLAMILADRANHVVKLAGRLDKALVADAKATGDLTEFTCTKERTSATFSAEELAQIPLPVKLRFSHLKHKKTNAFGDGRRREVKCVADGVERTSLLWMIPRKLVSPSTSKAFKGKSHG